MKKSPLIYAFLILLLLSTLLWVFTGCAKPAPAPTSSGYENSTRWRDLGVIYKVMTPSGDVSSVIRIIEDMKTGNLYISGDKASGVSGFELWVDSHGQPLTIQNMSEDFLKNQIQQ